MTDSCHTIGRYCVIGAGPSGLAAVKNLAQCGIEVDCFEREDDVGGIWYYGRPSSSVCAATHLISSKRQTEYTDFPMPTGYPPYPSHRQALDYLRSYARHFGLYDHIQFNTSVERVEPRPEGWQVSLDDGSAPRDYAGVVIANGHHREPQMPVFPGEFSGQTMHSRDYKTPEVLRGKRVLVVGAGNSGCDIAAEAAQHAEKAFISLRRGYYFMPKFLWGAPIDSCGEQMLRWHAPLWLRRLAARLLLRVAAGPPERYGLPRPDHRLFETHPIVNSQILYYLGHGRIEPKPDVAELRGASVRFADGSEEPIDLVIYATGFRITFPFIDNEHLNWREGCPRLYLNAFHPQRDDLFVVGLLQPDSGLWCLSDLQSQLIALYIAACRAGLPAAGWFRRLKSELPPDLGHGIRYLPSPRHLLEVEHFGYRRGLEKLVRRMARAVEAAGTPAQELAAAAAAQ
jgi:hypothetical protein